MTRFSLASLRLPFTALAAAALLALTACATPSPGAGAGGDTPAFGDVAPGPPSTDVVGQGTVMDVDGTVELCLGPIAESYPPQCSGIPLTEWTWEGLDGFETSGDVRWGAYAVTGIYDGETFEMTQTAVSLALYDPMPLPDPTGGRAGTSDEATLLRIQDSLPKRLGEQYLSSWPENGYLWVDVLWDDGTLQGAADAEFGADVVVVRSALREIG